VIVEAIAAVAGGATAQSRQPAVFFRIQYYDKVRGAGVAARTAEISAARP
jgi:hypothetical protein